MLQRIEKAQAGRGLSLLTVATDGPETRPRIPDFLRKHRLSVKVLLDDPKGRAGYPVAGVPSLYVIDRKGSIAGVPAESLGHDEKRLGRLLEGLLAGSPATGRALVSLDAVSPGWGALWKVPLEGNITELTVAPPVGSEPAVVAALVGGRLERWSPAGEPQGGWRVDRNAVTVRSADLDRDGRREWILGGGGTLTLMDGAGERYWMVGDGSEEVNSMSEILDLRDTDGDGFGDILVRSADRITRWNHVGGPTWNQGGFRDSTAVLAGPSGTLLVQRGDRIEQLAPDGRRQGARPAPPFPRFWGTLAPGEGRPLEVFGDSDHYYQHVETAGDIDGDGKRDLVFVKPPGIAVYDADARLLLRLRVDGAEWYLPVAFGDLDGRPGDEIIVAVGNYGLVALGKGPPVPSERVRSAF